MKELATAQTKLKLIDKLSNCIQGEVTSTQKDDIAYLIHTIIEAEEVHSGMYREVVKWQIESNKSAFVTV